jgi:hypothetical protein
VSSSRAIRQRTLLTAAAGAAALGLVVTFPDDLAGSHREVSPTVSTDSHGGRQIALAAAGPMRDVSLPIRVRIPAIGVDSPLGRLGVDAAGALVPPTDFARAGWFAAGPVPGDIGPAVIAGHVDSRDGPAVFFRLADLAAGDEILVERADGTTARFTVSRTARYPKDGFPTEEVYGPTPRAELRLITCGGEFDADRRSYRDNIVVTAVLS